MIFNKIKNTLSGISIITLLVFMTCIVSSCKSDKKTDKIAATKTKPLSFEIPAKGNSWVTNNVALNNRIIRENGIRNWKDSETQIKTYFKTEKVGKINLVLKLNTIEESSKIRISLGKDVKELTIKKSDKKEVSVGEFNISKAGYQTIEIKGLQKNGAVYADIDAFIIEGTATAGNVYFIKEDFYFGRRGPSVHLSYELPKEKKVTYFYNEISVPEGEDVIGSYYMANGFKDGYFGIQVNSATERRVLFSVWSPFETQDPNEIPDDHKIILLDKGSGVKTGEFGNEGSGGQSYKVYPWKASTTYKFLLKGVPAENNSTDYTAYFYIPEENKWSLIASFRRPQGSKYLQNLYSFLENFETKTGYISRKANYNNQWIYTSDNEWIELTKAKFTADATARKESRLDYAGGVEENQFFMKNCGFFSENTPIDTAFTRIKNGIAPNINFSNLETLK
jgi:hypothetical protein